MAAYLIRRLWQMIPTLLGVVLLVFFLFKYFGSDPAIILGGLNASPEQIESIRDQLGLNKPVWSSCGSSSSRSSPSTGARAGRPTSRWPTCSPPACRRR